MSNLLGLEEAKQNVGSGSYDEPGPELAAHTKSGANWFYWIAGLSVINSVIFVFGANVSFLAGLGITQLMDAIIGLSIEQGAPTFLKVVAVGFDLIVVAIFALIAYYSGRRFTAAFIIGIVLYLLDGLLLLVLGAYLTAGFHAFALYFIIRGFFACRKLNTHAAGRAFQSPVTE